MDQNEFKNVWFPYQENFYRLAFYYLASESDAVDVIQDVYVKLWNHREQLEGVSSPKAYGLVLVRNLCLDRLRRLKRKTEIVGLDEEAVPQISIGPEAEYCMKERVHQVRQLIGMLPEDQRKLMLMKFYENKDDDEIARETGWSRVNVRVKLSRARRFIREKIKKQE